MSERHPSNLAASVRQRLLNLARERGDEFQLVLMRYGVERLLYRLGQSRHSDAFVLKGAVLFQMWTGQPHRSTLDVDFLATGKENAVEPYESIVRAICVQPVEPDGLVFDPTTVRGEAIREEQRYHGVRIHVTAMLGTARVPMQIDIGFGDAITPAAERVLYPSLISLPTATLAAYPRETVVAEKYEAMVSLGIANSRMKDFYDLWVLATCFQFDGRVLATAIAATFQRRGTLLPLELPLALTDAFVADQAKHAQWTAFVRRGRLVITVPPFSEVVSVLADFLWPPTLSAAAVGTAAPTAWSPSRKWL